MLKKLSFAAIAIAGTSLVSVAPASASTSCPPGQIAYPTGPTTAICIDDPTPPTDIPTPSAVLAALGMGFAGLRKKMKGQAETAE